MSTATLPILAGPNTGLGWSITREMLWSSTKAVSISGKETAVSNWSYPRYRWTIGYNVLRQGALQGSTWTEMEQLFGFINARQGGYDSWLYKDSQDNTVTGQAIGTGDGATLNFQLVRAFGSFVEPILAPDLVATHAVYLNGVGAPSYTITPWNTTDPAGPGVIKFGTAPGAGVAITADFSWFWPVRFDSDVATFEEMYAGLTQLKSLKFTSIK